MSFSHKLRIIIWIIAAILFFLLQISSSAIPEEYQAAYGAAVYIPAIIFLPILCYFIFLDILWLLKKRWPGLPSIVIFLSSVLFIITALFTEGAALLFAPMIILPLFIPLTADILVKYFKKTQVLTRTEVSAGIIGSLVIIGSILLFLYLSFLSSSGVNIVG